MVEHNEVALGDLIRDTLINNVDVKALINNRVYKAILDDVDSPTYPCANFAFGGGTLVMNMDGYENLSLQLWVWSDNSYNECHEIYQKVTAALKNIRLSSTTASVNCVCQPTSPPSEFRAVNKYGLAAVWRARVIYG